MPLLGKSPTYIRRWPALDDFRFRLILENSDKVLYENAEIGRAFAKVIRSVVADGAFGNESWQDFQDMSG